MKQKFISPLSSLGSSSSFLYISFTHMYLISTTWVLSFQCVMTCLFFCHFYVSKWDLNWLTYPFLPDNAFIFYLFLPEYIHNKLPKFPYFINPLHNFCHTHLTTFIYLCFTLHFRLSVLGCLSFKTMHYSRIPWFMRWIVSEDPTLRSRESYVTQR